MARASGSSSTSASFYSLLFISSLLFASHFYTSEAQAKGLSFDFYQKSCPRLEAIVREHLKRFAKVDKGQFPGLLRIFFHDCWVQGCDASIMLNGTDGERKERNNIGIREEAITTIEVLRSLVQNECGRVVSCSDLIVLAARDAVVLSGGPNFAVPLGRRDGLTFNRNGTNALPSPFANVTTTLKAFKDRGFDATDVVALSGAHTFGRAHCGSFSDRFTSPKNPIDQTFFNNLKSLCAPGAPSTTTSVLDIQTPNDFDNKYYVNLMNNKGLFTSDQDLLSDPETSKLVKDFAANQNLFFDKFAKAVVKLSQMDVLTGNKGEIRAKCSVTNQSNKSLLTSVVEELVELADQF